MEREKITELARMINESRNIVFFGGAGVSTESGLKDYRSEDGIYNTVKEYGVPPEVILSHTFFYEKPDVFYDFYYKYFLSGSAKPNRAHYALAELEKRGKLKAVITQNVDGLHTAAGSKNVIELHGTVYKNHCVKCKCEAGFDRMVSFGGKIPTCEKCKGILKPDVVLYEEPLDAVTTQKAVTEIMNADMLIIGGTSLTVYPAASYIGYFSGKYTALINKGETERSSNADIVIKDSIGEALEAVINNLKKDLRKSF